MPIWPAVPSRFSTTLAAPTEHNNEGSITRQLAVPSLRRRLVFQFAVANASEDAAQASQFRKYAILTYLPLAMLKRMTSVWSKEMTEQESSLLADSRNQAVTFPGVYSGAAVIYRECYCLPVRYELSDLHYRYFEYASLLSSQGVVKEAMVLLKLTLGDNTGPGSAIQERLPRMKSEPAGMNTIKIDRMALPAQPSLHTARFSMYAFYAPSTPAPAPAPAPTNLAYSPPPSNIGVPASGFSTSNQGESLTQPQHLRVALPPHQAPAPLPPREWKIEDRTMHLSFVTVGARAHPCRRKCDRLTVRLLYSRAYSWTTRTTYPATTAATSNVLSCGEVTFRGEQVYIVTSLTADAQPIPSSTTNAFVGTVLTSSAPANTLHLQDRMFVRRRFWVRDRTLMLRLRLNKLLRTGLLM
ncbi:hypothetical protein EDD18DRAFT_1115702 [Armillaria luteobubalina]|uniref:Uncharacterized protein n=1 Tax=Armillaria luteobubalina TaxID=153913 RepID=A0AA39U257_9AGAR|nr:hypothetical protein EDD18DRAFT_1115702 [Armillaria luteobubalina]